MPWFSLGLLTARGIVEWFLYGGTVYTYSVMMVLLLPGGVFFLYQAWRQAPMLIVQTHRGTSRLEFKGDRTKETITDLERAAREQGYALVRGRDEWQ